MTFVLDTSVAAGWFLENQASVYTEAVGAMLQEDRAVVPAVWELEVTNVLRTACMRRTMNAQAAQLVLTQIAVLPIEVDREPVLRAELLALAIRFGLSTYDAAYLELALRLQLPVATLDSALREAALASGVGVVDAG
jgi:predicted nucleic acid-binding protein